MYRCVFTASVSAAHPGAVSVWRTLVQLRSSASHLGAVTEQYMAHTSPSAGVEQKDAPQNNAVQVQRSMVQARYVALQHRCRTHTGVEQCGTP